MTSHVAIPRSRVADPAEAPPIRWGIIAPGWIAGQFTDAVHKHTRSRVVAVGSSSRERAEAFAAEYEVPRWYDSYEQVVADPEVDAIYVASPHSHHHQQGLLALAAGKPVLMEKAFTQNAGQAREVIEAAHQRGLLLMEAMWTRFLPHFDVIRQLLADGSLGDVQTVISDHGQYFELEPTHRLLNPDLAGGATLDLGVYPISFTSFVLGAPDSIVADGRHGRHRRRRPGVRGPAHRRSSRARLRHPDRENPHQRNYQRDGRSDRDHRPVLCPQPVQLISRDGDVATMEAGPIAGHEGLAYEAAHFATLLAEGATESPLLTIAETLSVMETMDEIRRQINLVYPNER